MVPARPTLTNALAGLLPPTGTSPFNGCDITPVAPPFGDEGVALVPEGRRLFASMTREGKSRAR